VIRHRNRRIDDRLRQLCAKSLTAADGELEPIRQELLKLLHHKVERLKRRAARLLLGGEHLEPERRSTDVVDPLPNTKEKAA
jgi:hypothetical protein